VELLELDLELVDLCLLDSEAFRQKDLVLYLPTLLLRYHQPPVLLDIYELLFLEKQMGPYLNSAVQHHRRV
jgi:hypothetical protein